MTARPPNARPAANPAIAMPASESGSRARVGDVRTLRTLEYVLGADPAVVRGFAQAAADQAAAGPLTLADRDRLLKRGERLGLRRFDANLVLAAVEQRQRQSAPVYPRAANVRLAEPSSNRRRVLWPTAATAVVLQSVIVAVAWWLVA